MLLKRHFPELPRLANIVTVESCAGGTWSKARELARECEVSLMLDMRTDAERTSPPKEGTLQNLAVMNRMGYARANGIMFSEGIRQRIRRPLSAKQRGLPCLVDPLFEAYVDYVAEVERAFDPGKAMEGYFYGEHRGIAIIGSSAPWWATERLYVHCLLEGFWPRLRIFHV